LRAVGDERVDLRFDDGMAPGIDLDEDFVGEFRPAVVA